MTRSPLALAALASAAIPGLAPVSVQGVSARAGEQYQVAFLEDQEGRRWVVRLPLNAVAAAQLDEGGALAHLLARRLPFSVPVPQGYAHLKEGGRAAVYPRLSGEPLDWTLLPAASPLAAGVGRAIAAVHNVDRALYEEAGVPSYDADAARSRRLAELDRGASTGHVPTGLLSRWEQALEEVTLWRFASTPTHGNLTDRHVLVAHDDAEESAPGAQDTVKGLTGWERAQVADPADDFASLVRDCAPAAFDTVLEAYAHARSERPDKHLERRARLAGELLGLAALLEAVTAEDEELVATRAQALRRLDEHAHDTDLLPPTTRFVTAGLPAFPDSLEGGELSELDAPADGSTDSAWSEESEESDDEPVDEPVDLEQSGVEQPSADEPVDLEQSGVEQPSADEQVDLEQSGVEQPVLDESAPDRADLESADDQPARPADGAATDGPADGDPRSS